MEKVGYVVVRQWAKASLCLSVVELQKFRSRQLSTLSLALAYNIRQEVGIIDKFS